MLNILYLLIASSGFAALSWEVIWQLKATLALGISAWGTALTLAVMMSGMSLGAFLMGRALRHRTTINPIRLYGALEIVIGVCGLLLNPAFQLLEIFDSWAYSMLPDSISLVYMLGISFIFSVPTLCIGATLPIFKLIAGQRQLSLTKLYSLNTLGAAIGILFVAFILLPIFGITHSIWIIAATNIMVGLVALSLRDQTATQINVSEASHSLREYAIVFVTGFAIFTLEIAWFRSFADVFPNTTDIFAIILAAVLIALGLGAKNVARLKQQKKMLGAQLCLAGILILLVTPLIERIDLIFAYFKHVASTNTIAMNADAPSLNWLFTPDSFSVSWLAIGTYLLQVLLKFFFACLIIIPPLRLLGVAFPWLLDNQSSPDNAGKLTAINTFAAIVGSISAAWILLPTIGFTKTAWLAGVLVMITGVTILPGLKRVSWAILGSMALFVAIHFETGIGTTRAQGYFATDNKGNYAKVLAYFEGPEATVAAIEYNDSSRALLINSASAALQSDTTYKSSAHYMAWMGHLPMLLHTNPKHALVICFGTGQTANALRNENPETLDIVDVNPAIFKLANYFQSNEAVLEDARVKTTVMDGRAYLRRTNKMYDVITLEPMPPNTIGVNALYSREFYQLARSKLADNGIIAQWLPFHVVAPYYTASIVKTFIDVFPNAVLWFDSDSKNGILLGINNNTIALATHWPGFLRTTLKRDLSLEKIQQRIALNATQLTEYGRYGEVINDDNQLLSYGKALYVSGQPLQENLTLLRHLSHKSIY